MISPVNNNYAIDFPDYSEIEVQGSNNIPEIADNPAEVNNVRDVGSAAVLSASAVALDELKAHELQNNFLSNVNEFKNGDLSVEEFSDFLNENGVTSINLQENNLSNESLISALFSITNQNITNDENSNNLSKYADMMDKINEETQSAGVQEKLSAYTANLRN